MLEDPWLEDASFAPGKLCAHLRACMTPLRRWFALSRRAWLNSRAGSKAVLLRTRTFVLAAFQFNDRSSKSRGKELFLLTSGGSSWCMLSVGFDIKVRWERATTSAHVPARHSHDRKRFHVTQKKTQTTQTQVGKLGCPGFPGAHSVMTDIQIPYQSVRLTCAIEKTNCKLHKTHITTFCVDVF